MTGKGTILTGESKSVEATRNLLARKNRLSVMSVIILY